VTKNDLLATIHFDKPDWKMFIILHFCLGFMKVMALYEGNGTFGKTQDGARMFAGLPS